MDFFDMLNKKEVSEIIEPDTENIGNDNCDIDTTGENKEEDIETESEE